MGQAPDWVRDSVFYHIFPDRFQNGDPANDPKEVELWSGKPERDSFYGGDLPGIEQRLDYLSDLGANALYLTPVFTAPSNHKYDTADYYEVDPHFGGDVALKSLVQSLHERGMRIVLDGVFNHCGGLFEPFRDLLRHGEQSPFRDWFLPRSFPLRQTPEPNYKVCGGAHNLPKFNDDQPRVRQYLYRVATYWLRESGIDGWRLDVPWETSHEFWRGFRRAVKRARPDAYLAGELWGDPRPWLRGDQFDGVTNYPLRELLIRFFAQQAVDAATFQRELDSLARSCGRFTAFTLNMLGSHDTARIMTIAGGDADLVAQMFAFLFAYPGCPMIYYGDELGLQGGNDPGCRAPMEWNTDLWCRPLHDRVRFLARFRREHRALRRGGYRVAYTRERLFGFFRKHGDDVVLALFNAGFQEDEALVSLPRVHHGDWYDALSGERFHPRRGMLGIPLSSRGTRLLVPQ